MQYQVTLFCETGKYKPVSALVEMPTTAAKQEIQVKGIQKICNKRYWTTRELKAYQYTKCKIRVYDKEKIAKENAERYEKIKQEKGWK